MPWNYRETLARLATPAAAQYDESCPAEKDRLRPYVSGYLEIAAKPHFQNLESADVL
jgi:hypothetical protein